MKRFANVILFLTFLFHFCNSNGQDSIKGKKLSVLISPAIISLDGYSIGLQPGIQYSFNNKWSVATEATFLLSNRLSQDAEDQRYFRAAIEVKKYFSNNDRCSRYISLQTSYALRHFTNALGGRFRSEHQSYDSLFVYDKATVTTPVLQTFLKLGKEFNLGRRLFFDLFIGAGARTTFTEYSSIENLLQEENTLRREPFDANPAYLYNYTITRFAATAGFRVGYHF